MLLRTPYFSGPLLVLDAAPQNAVHELLEFFDLVFFRLAEFLHRRGQPRTGAPFVLQTGNPGAGVLGHNAVVRAVISHHRRRAVKRVVCVREPLFREQKIPQVGNGLRLGLDHVITDRLHQAVVVSDRQPRTAPLLAAQGVILPAVFGWGILLSPRSRLRVPRSPT